MQVFKSFFKILNKHKGQMLLYLCIFISIMSVLSANKAFNNTSSYETTKPRFAVFDYDNSVESHALTGYLSKTCTKTDIKNDKKETMQDELFARNVNCILIIKEGFSLDVVTIPGTQAATTFESAINSFTKTYNTYIASGYSEADALAAVNTSLSQKASVSLLSGKSVTSHSGIYYCFSYLGWVLLVMMIAGIAPVLQVFSKKEIKERISCSSYKFANYNRELLLGVILTGLVVCAVIFVSATIMFKGSTFSFSGFLFTLNMLCYMLVSLAFAFFISKITSNSEILNMFANTVSLGMAFLCGIFVPEEFLSDGIIKAAHFLPAYWYNQAVKNIDFHPVKELDFIFMCMGIQLLFATAIIVVALRITKAPDGFKKHTVAAAAHK